MTNVAFGAPGIEPQERWEENAGYSPSTLATVIAGLVCAADFAKERAETSTSDFILSWSMPTGWSWSKVFRDTTSGSTQPMWSYLTL